MFKIIKTVKTIDNKIREISDSDKCTFVLWVGNKRLIKRKLFEEYLSKMYSI